MGKYLELFRSAFDSSIDEKTKLENKPYVAYSTVTRDVVYTIVPKKEEEDTSTTFRFISREDDNVVDFYSNAWLGRIDDNKKQNVYLKVNDGEWISIANQTSFTLNTGDKLYFKNEGEDLKTFNVNGSSASIGTTTKTFDVAGNVDEFMIPSGNMTDKQYQNLFVSTKIVDASELILPATELAAECYAYMFRYCTSLTTVPELPATILANSCYSNMFRGCTSLTTAPELPATTLAENCYQSMFYQCSSLTTTPVLPATTLAKGCYSGMFNDCTSLTTAPELPATTLAENCYQSMFSRCTSLTSTPEVLPATTLAESCYRYMFEECTSLAAAPVLPATTLAEGCYNGMFQRCTNLNHITCLATDISATDCAKMWVYGVSSSGTFVKHPNMNDWAIGLTYGTPSGWVVVDAEL